MVVNSIWMRNIFKPKQKNFLGFLLTSDSEVGEALNSGGGISAARSAGVPREEPERSSRGAREELEGTDGRSRVRGAEKRDRALRAVGPRVARSSHCVRATEAEEPNFSDNHRLFGSSRD